MAQFLTPSMISNLRYSLGQSRADFARIMAVSLETIFAWESGAQVPNAVETSSLVRLHQQSEVYADRTALRPAMEIALRDRHLDQIHAADVVISSPNLT
jgi:DNA-binding XRE family transcriptional regulator